MNQLTRLLTEMLFLCDDFSEKAFRFLSKR